MFKELSKGLAKSGRDWRDIAQTQRLIDSYERDRRGSARRRDQLQELDRLTRERDRLSGQLLDATTTLGGTSPPAYVAPREVAAVRRKIAALDLRLRRMVAEPNPRSGLIEKLGADLKVEMSVLGHQILLILGIVVAYIIFFGALLWIFPYVWNWFWSFP